MFALLSKTFHQYNLHRLRVQIELRRILQITNNENNNNNNNNNNSNDDDDDHHHHHNNDDNIKNNIIIKNNNKGYNNINENGNYNK